MIRYAVARRRMVEEQLIARGVADPRVLEAMNAVPREEFVPPALAGQAYSGHPLHIGERQTISQPFIVAHMTERLRLRGGEKVLEIGTGSGYQTAILARLVRHVFTVERLVRLSNRARRTLYRLGIVNVTFRIGDGSLGWREEAPFDVILAAAAAPDVPAVLVEQLAEGGRLILPIGGEETQLLTEVVKREGEIHREPLTGCRFVKLYGQHGWEPGS